LSSTIEPLAAFILPFMALWQARQFAGSWQEPGVGDRKSARKSKGAKITSSLLFDISTSINIIAALTNSWNFLINVQPGITMNVNVNPD
jgi:hypothetical protein